MWLTVVKLNSKILHQCAGNVRQAVQNRTVLWFKQLPERVDLAASNNWKTGRTGYSVSATYGFVSNHSSSKVSCKSNKSHDLSVQWKPLVVQRSRDEPEMSEYSRVIGKDWENIRTVCVALTVSQTRTMVGL